MQIIMFIEPYIKCFPWLNDTEGSSFPWYELIPYSFGTEKQITKHLWFPNKMS